MAMDMAVPAQTPRATRIFGGTLFWPVGASGGVTQASSPVTTEPTNANDPAKASWLVLVKMWVSIKATTPASSSHTARVVATTKATCLDNAQSCGTRGNKKRQQSRKKMSTNIATGTEYMADWAPQ